MFGIGNNGFLGVDIGTYSIKVIEIKVKNNKPVLTNYAWMTLDDVKGKEDTSFSDTNWPVYLKRIIKEAKISAKNAYVSIPSASSLITMVEFPNIAREDLDQAIRYEAHKYIPTSLDDVVLSWDVVSIKNPNSLTEKFSGGPVERTGNATETKIQVVLVAAPKSKVEKYEKLIRSLGLDLKSIEIDSFSLVRSLIGNDPGNFIIVDIGSRICNIILVEKGIIKVNRSINAGGREVTRTIARSLQVDESKAKEMKNAGKDFLSGQSKVFFPVFNSIIEEIRRVLSDFYMSEGGTDIDSVILSGGTANFTGLANHMQNALRIKTIVGNPFGRITSDDKIKKRANQIRVQFSVSAGLALKGAEEYIKNV
jgi:type IV pilus assembly protein PilM